MKSHAAPVHSSFSNLCFQLSARRPAPHSVQRRSILQAPPQHSDHALLDRRFSGRQVLVNIHWQRALADSNHCQYVHILQLSTDHRICPPQLLMKMYDAGEKTVLYPHLMGFCSHVAAASSHSMRTERRTLMMEVSSGRRSLPASSPVSYR